VQRLLKRIEQALKNQEFVLYYQPIIRLNDNAILGNEALIRWQHPKLGLLLPFDEPYKFLPLAENSPQLMLSLCEWVFDQAVRDRPKLTGDFLTINVSAKSIEQNSFVAMVCDRAIISDQPTIFLEITERVAMNFKNKINQIGNFCQYGLGFCLDDFGQELHGLIQLHKLTEVLPSNKFVKVKLDIYFTRHLYDPVIIILLEGFLTSLKELKIEAIAEGIETEEQARIWRELGAEYGQGWLWGRAEPL
jgi:EAL domain-containing protein (putative c-di-GMP-specific phosphodiesterase class I)